MDRLLADYLPPVLSKTREMSVIMAAEQPEIENAWVTWRQVLDNLFVQTGDARGLSRWEKVIGILPKGRDTIEQRRTQIMLRLNEKLPFTYRALQGMLAGVFGPDGFVLEVDPLAYRLSVTLPIDIDGGVNLRGLPGMLARVVPANIIYKMGAEIDARADARARFLLRRFGMRAAFSVFGIETIRFDGMRRFGGPFPFSPVFTRGANFRAFEVCFRQPVQPRILPGISMGVAAVAGGVVTLQRMAVWTHYNVFGLSIVYFDGSRTFDGVLAYRADFERGANLRSLHIRAAPLVAAPAQRVGAYFGVVSSVRQNAAARRWHIRAPVFGGPRVVPDNLRVKTQTAACPDVAAAVTYDTMYRMDGGYAFDGTRRFNADVINQIL